MSERIDLLVVDNDPAICRLVEKALTSKGFVVTSAGTAEEGLAKTKGTRYEVVLLDLHLPGIQGLEMLRELRNGVSVPEVVVLTGHPGVETAIEAMKLGARDYITKPVNLDELAQILGSASEHFRLKRENVVLRSLLSNQVFPTGTVVSDSREMKKVLQLVKRIAASEASVLINGETGVGKGLIAKLVHQDSPRAKYPMMHLNCSALTDELLESELFGHEKGSFTGAVGEKPGLFEVADGGTLFLDEVAEMSTSMQAKLLQVLDSGELRRVGSTAFRRVDVRILSATNKDLREEVQEKRFRGDLLFRLGVVTVTLPPLRERREDIPGLVRLYLKRYRLAGKEPKTISEAALRSLMEYDWPGNVRELANVIEGAVLLSRGSEIRAADLPTVTRPAAVSSPQPEGEPLPLSEIERLHIRRALEFTEGKKAPAARLLGIDVKTLYNKIKVYDIQV